MEKAWRTIFLVIHNNNETTHQLYLKFLMNVVRYIQEESPLLGYNDIIRVFV